MSLLNLLEEFVMFEKIRKMKNKKGFTLVELIVVLVILAILAALLIPALTGYIDKANNEKVVAETRQVLVAAQTVVSEDYGQNVDVTASGYVSDDLKTEILTLAECKGTIVSLSIQGKTGTTAEKPVGKIIAMQYTSTSGKTCTYDATKTGDEMYKVS